MSVLSDIGNAVKGFLPVQVWSALLLSVLVSAGLAAAYVFGGGIELLENGQYVLIDRYAFTITFLTGGIGVAGSFYVYFRDVSSALAVVVSLVWSLLFGLEDVLVYLFLVDVSIPEKLVWLNDSPVGVFTGFLGFDVVTRSALFASVLVSGVLLLFFVKTLVLIEESFLGIEI